jgi:hypothetical protein
MCSRVQWVGGRAVLAVWSRQVQERDEHRAVCELSKHDLLWSLESDKYLELHTMQGIFVVLGRQ